MAAGPFDTRKRAADRIPAEFVVGDRTFNVKRSGKALKQIVGITDEPGDDSAANIEFMYHGISLVLVDPNQDSTVSQADADGIWHPKPEWLENEVDFEVAEDFLMMILPQRAEGNSTPPSVPSTESTA